LPECGDLGVPVRSGLLFYLKSGEVSHVVAGWDDVRNLMLQRNLLATHLAGQMPLPPMLQSPHICGRCYHNERCMVLHKVCAPPWPQEFRPAFH